MEFHDTQITLNVAGKDKEIPARIGYLHEAAIPAQREKCGRDVSPAERANVELVQLELQIGDRWVNFSFLVALFSEAQAEALTREILGEK